MALENLKLSISNLWEEFARTENAAVGLAVNLTLAIVGLVVFELATNVWIEVAAVAWTLLNLWGILSWVIGR